MLKGKKQELLKQLEKLVLNIESLNNFKQQVFNSYANEEISISAKQAILVELYERADTQDLFYMKITDKKPMPIEIQYPSENENEDESYSESESYSYSEEEYS